MQQSLSLMQQSMLVIQDVLQAQLINPPCSVPSPKHGDILPRPNPNATLSQEGLSPPELDADLQYKEAHPKKPSATQLTNLLNTEVTALTRLPVWPNATLSQEGLSPPELDADLQYKEAYPKKPSATQLTDQVHLNTEVTVLAHLPVRLWMTQNPTKSSVN
jgi:hypothetical protein